MVSAMGQVKRLIFGISPKETTFARRGFPGGRVGVRQRLEKVGQTFVQGYNAALCDHDPGRLALQLNTVEAELRGFAFEGAAMSLALLDQITPWQRGRFDAFLRGPANHHTYMVHVGAGWALARLRLGVERYMSKLDPLLRWLVIDGYGFHEGYFHWRRSFDEQRVPRTISGYGCRAFDQGLGRSLWFVKCADIDRIAYAISSFPYSRQADLWSGVGLACTYAGGIEAEEIERLVRIAGPFHLHLAQGAAFAAKARQRAGNPVEHTDVACEILCNLPANAAAWITDLAIEGLSTSDNHPEYESWRQRIQNLLAKEAAIV